MYVFNFSKYIVSVSCRQKLMFKQLRIINIPRAVQVNWKLFKEKEHSSLASQIENSPTVSNFHAT